MIFFSHNIKMNNDRFMSFFQDRRVLHGRNSFLGERQLNKGGILKFGQKFPFIKE